LTESGLEKIDLKNNTRKLQEELAVLKDQLNHKEFTGSKSTESQKRLEDSIARLTAELESETTKRLKQEEQYLLHIKEHEDTRKKLEQDLKDRIDHLEKQKQELEAEKAKVSDRTSSIGLSEKQKEEYEKKLSEWEVKYSKLQLQSEQQALRLSTSDLISSTPKKLEDSGEVNAKEISRYDCIQKRPMSILKQRCHRCFSMDIGLLNTISVICSSHLQYLTYVAGQQA
jgi:chromosome segregation ATPase